MSIKLSYLNLLAAGIFGAGISQANASTSVFSTNFDSIIPTEISAGTAFLTGVQGYAGLGSSSSQFDGSFLRSQTGNIVTLTLNDLPVHQTLSLEFLFAAIDSLDGSFDGNPLTGDYLTVKLDGKQLFHESFANADPSLIQSYVAPPGGELARAIDLGFTGPGSYYTDSAYNMSVDPVFQNILHTASSATIEFVIESEEYQELDDESWAMDNLHVSVSPIPEPSTYAMLLAGLGLLGFVVHPRKDIVM